MLPFLEFTLTSFVLFFDMRSKEEKHSFSEGSLIK